jgi:hypothetical protein
MWLEAGDVCLSVARVGEWSLALADSVAEIQFDLPLLAHLITFVDGEEEGFLVTTRKRLGGVIYFEHCIHEPDRTCERDSMPF